MEKIQVNDIKLAFERRGKGTPLVLLHGYPLDHHTWGFVASKLEDTFDVIMPDLRGFGESTTSDTVFTMDDFASDIAGLLDHLGIKKTAITGHSMGGYVALAFTKLYPERVSGLGLVSTQTLADPPDRKEGRYKSAADVGENGIGSVVDTMSAKFTENKEIQLSSREIMERQKPGAFIGALKAMAERIDTTSLLSSINFPLVVIHGDKDNLIPIERAREVKSLVPNAHLIELQNVGHLPMMEAAQETAEALKLLK
jgi:3-oxoadipate enol-lactonase